MLPLSKNRGCAEYIFSNSYDVDVQLHCVVRVRHYMAERQRLITNRSTGTVNRTITLWLPARPLVPVSTAIGLEGRNMGGIPS